MFPLTTPLSAQRRLSARQNNLEALSGGDIRLGKIDIDDNKLHIVSATRHTTTWQLVPPFPDISTSSPEPFAFATCFLRRLSDADKNRLTACWPSLSSAIIGLRLPWQKNTAKLCRTLALSGHHNNLMALNAADDGEGGASAAHHRGGDTSTDTNR
ncbi:hypothetical protein AC578_10217 [Pseudocercospora eumusae]|uniref:Uncharacterized protein n=1 Tax=Pseudocercospora eumusae TaxID=321146 RepID=A0A139HYT7_9PEZI|nr:hypothetical protein AC578_10217 [Pseudocercospora eumusae]